LLFVSRRSDASSLEVFSKFAKRSLCNPSFSFKLLLLDSTNATFDLFWSTFFWRADISVLILLILFSVSSIWVRYFFLSCSQELILSSILFSYSGRRSFVVFERSSIICDRRSNVGCSPSAERALICERATFCDLIF
jgi:hypothetical protein